MVLRHCDDLAWQHVGIKASSFFTHELLSFKYRDSKTSFFHCLYLFTTLILPDVAMLIIPTGYSVRDIKQVCRFWKEEGISSEPLSLEDQDFAKI